ncbi:MAG: hypothetical protein AB7V46_19520 [Thermomicrobiales bacterium]
MDLVEDSFRLLAFTLFICLVILVIGWVIDFRERRKLQRILNYLNNVNRSE